MSEKSGETVAMENERIGVLEAQMAAHFKADEVGFSRINTDTTEIKATLREMSSDLKSAVERIHGRIDDEASKARHALNNVSQATTNDAARIERTARAEVKLAMDFAQDAHDKIADQKNWILTGLVALALAIIGWFFDHFFGGNHA